MIRNYLIAYNLLLSIGWLLVFVLWWADDFNLNEYSLLLLNVVQGLAVLEIFHAATKWVKAPVFTTFLQVFSRIFVLILLNVLPIDGFIIVEEFNALIPLMTAWCVTEVFRYAYYFTSLLGKTPSWLTAIRYSTFLFLYPLGVAGELMIIYLVVEMNGFELNLFNIILAIVTLNYIWGFPKMFGYMLKQRRKKL